MTSRDFDFTFGRAALLLVAGLGLAACEQPQAKSRAPMPPAPQVSLSEMRAQPVSLSYSYAGRIAAFREVEVRARVVGILLERAYVEGHKVRAGDVLFRIDPAPYEAEAARARAQLQQVRARLAQAERDSTRAVTLFNNKFGTEKARDDAISGVELGRASVAAAEAQLKTAEINLGYTTVTAPVDGITSLQAVPEGSLVGTASNSLLARITQVDPVYVHFSFSDSELSEIRELLKSGKGTETLTVQLSFADGRQHAGEGHIDFIDASLDHQTGTIRARAIVPNPDRALLPGHFVRATVTGVVLDNAIVVPQVAVMQGPQGQYVYAMDDGKAAVRPISIGRPVGQGWIVTSGLKAGDRVITEGIIKVRPGGPVHAMQDDERKVVSQVGQ